MIDWNEWHAFVVGFFEIACPKKAKIPMPKQVRAIIKGEWWYYQGGRSLAFILWIIFIVAIVEGIWIL